ncbi:MAG: HNH endonuclease, partial [Candidatus Thiodiazotropha sp. (ex Rostrolucina anterorostrata)]|nr:HNH endonuclease [Candidatus Thiodiazotropha sp. (ex Rostrolucina anterorostrata)]
RLEKSIESITKFLDKYRDLYARRREAAKRTRESRKQNACQQPCGETKWGTQLPSKKNGSFEGERGNSKWTSKDGKVSVDYKEGYPDFKTSKGPNGEPAVIKEVEIAQTGRNSDFSAANKAADYSKIPDKYTWHHKEDGVTMQLVRQDVHNKTIGGAPHTGGVSISKDPQF